MTHTPLVSIIVPVYNTEIYLHQCLNSLLNQTLKNIEIICVDDGSKDDSLKILKQYAASDSRIKILEQKHSKQGKARNLGLEIAKGEYIGFVDSDDWVEDTMFENLYRTARETHSDITMCSITTYNEQTKTYNKHDTYQSLDIFPEAFDERTFTPEETYDYLFRICVSPCNKIFKKSFLKKNSIKFPEKIYFEDQLFFFEAYLQAETISLIRDCCYYYRLFSATSTCHKNDLSKLNLFKMFRLQKKLLKKLKLYKKFKYDYYITKKHELLHFEKKINNSKIRVLYRILMFVSMPSLIFTPISNLIKEIKFVSAIKKLKKQKIVFWGASLFLEKIIKNYKLEDLNILGIIDINPHKRGKFLGKYQIFAPEDLEKLSTDQIVISIVNHSYTSNLQIKKYIHEHYKKEVKLITVNK